MEDMVILDINEIEFKQFPGGELHITNQWYDDLCVNNRISGAHKVICRIKSSDDIIKLCLFTDAYKRQYSNLPELIIPYIPYARQDRVPKAGEALSIKVFANILNSLKYPSVTVLDPHSDVSTALIDNVNIIKQYNIWSDVLQSLNCKFDLISPDAGALKKIYELQKEVSCIGCRVVNSCDNIRIGMKHRDTQTGQITGTSVDGEAKNDVAVIVDDICDGGRTFIELGKVLRNQYKTLILCITHGIFSKGIEVLDVFDTIYSTNSWNKSLTTKDNLKIIQIEDVI